MELLRQEYGDDREAMREHMQQLRRESNDKILKRLTPDQQKAYKIYMNEQRKKPSGKNGRIVNYQQRLSICNKFHR